jgi:membrane peptidoglycan carboxypeptidase
MERDLELIVECAAWRTPPPELTALEVMTVVLEDRRFFRHGGVDLQSVARELIKLISGRRHGGASTIDMQLVRTATGYRDKTFGRKLYETVLAMRLQRRCTKRQILWTYLAIAYFGTGLDGAEATAREVFGKGVCDLSLEEAAFQSAMLCIPRPRAAPEAWRQRVERRAKYGLDLMQSKRAQIVRDGVVTAAPP